MTCQEAIDFLSDYLDGSLPWRQRIQFLVHLGLCRDCRSYVNSFRQTMQLMRATMTDARADQFPPLPPELLQAIESARK